MRRVTTGGNVTSALRFKIGSGVLVAEGGDDDDDDDDKISGKGIVGGGGGIGFSVVCAVVVVSDGDGDGAAVGGFGRFVGKTDENSSRLLASEDDAMSVALDGVSTIDDGCSPAMVRRYALACMCTALSMTPSREHIAATSLAVQPRAPSSFSSMRALTRRNIRFVLLGSSIHATPKLLQTSCNSRCRAKDSALGPVSARHNDRGEATFEISSNGLQRNTLGCA